MWNVIKWILILVGGFYVVQFIFSLIGQVFSLLANSGSFWFIILIVVGFLIHKFWDDIVFEYEWLTGKYDKKKSSTTAPFNNTRSSQQNTNQGTTQAYQRQITTNIMQHEKPDGTFTFINGKYTDYVNKKEEMMMRWAAMLHNSNLSEEHRGLSGYLGPNWYPSPYKCHSCSDELFKTVFPVGKEFQVRAKGKGDWAIKRAFTCLSCEIIYAPRPGYRYTEEYTKYKAPSEQIYREKTIMMGIYGTTDGRADV